METVKFTRMADGDKADYELVFRKFEKLNETLPDRILSSVRHLEEGDAGFQVSRLEHSVQTATRAHRDGRSEEYVVMALVHDIGDGLAPHSHSEMIGAVLRPFVHPDIRWIATHHGAFQLYYFGHLTGGNRHAREAFRDHPLFDECATFCEKYDQQSFDPMYDSLPLEFFEPMVRRVFKQPRYLASGAE